MRAAHTVYSAGQFMQVLQAILYGHSDFQEYLIPVSTSATVGDTLVITAPNGQQFVLTAHVLMDFPVVEAEPVVVTADLPVEEPEPEPRKRAPRKASPRKPRKTNPDS
jgi:hypothetical protein